MAALQYLHYTKPETLQHEVCSIVSKKLKFFMAWESAESAERCHYNAFWHYNEYRKREDKLIQEKLLKHAGLRIRLVDSPSEFPPVHIFEGVSKSTEIATSIQLKPGQSVEFFGFFVPPSDGEYTFGFNNGNGGRIWIGDVACHEYMVENQNRKQNLVKGKYYAVRFHHWNSSKSDVPCDVTVNEKIIVYNPNEPFGFKRLTHADGTTTFNRNLLYYGLVKDKGSVNDNKNLYYCYFTGAFNKNAVSQEDYREIREKKGTNVITKYVVVPSDKDPKPKSKVISINESTDTLDLRANSTHDINVTKATRYLLPVQVNRNVLETDPMLIRGPKRYNSRTKKWSLGDLIKPRPTKTIQTWKYPSPIDVTDKLKSIGDVVIAPGNFNGIFGDTQTGARLVINTTNILKDSAKTNKKIMVDASCNLVANYGSDSATLFTPISCRSDKRLVIHNNGKVTVGGKELFDINKLIRANDTVHSTNDATHLNANKLWITQFYAALASGRDLDTIASDNGFYKLSFKYGELKCYYNVKAYRARAGLNFSISESNGVLPEAFFLYRPKYRELAGDNFIKKTFDNGKTRLFNTNSIEKTLTTTKYKNIGRNYPVLKLGNYLEDLNCETTCTDLNSCGHYVKATDGTCYIDVSNNTHPMYTNNPQTSEQNKPNIYIKEITMKNPNRALQYEPAQYYSPFRVIEDKFPVSTIPQAPDKSTKQTLRTYNLKNTNRAGNNSLYGIKEPFSDSDITTKDIPTRFLNQLPDAPDTSLEDGRIEDLQTIMFQQNVMYSVSSIAALSFLVGVIVLARK